MISVHASYMLPADRELWAQAIEGADRAIEEAAHPHEREWTETVTGATRTLCFLCENFYDAYHLRERIAAISLHGVEIIAEIRQ